MAVTLARTIILYIVVILSLRLMGKRQIGELQPGELVITILISECAAAPIQDLNRPVINGIIAILVLVILELIISTVCLKWSFASKIIEGHSVIVIKNGVIDQKALKSLRLSVNELIESLRIEGYFYIEDIAYALVETNGALSVLQKADKQPVTASLLDKKPPFLGMEYIVINDGSINKQELNESGMNYDNITDYLKENNLKLSDVFLLTVDNHQNFKYVKKDKKR